MLFFCANYLVRPPRAIVGGPQIFAAVYDRRKIPGRTTTAVADRRYTRLSHPRAFTLLELLAVITIIAILVSIGLGAGRRANEAGRIARAKAELSALSTALENYRCACGDYPQTNDAARLLQSLMGKRDPLNAVIVMRSLVEPARFTTGESRDPYSDPSAVLVDPWGQPYRYAYKTQNPWDNSSCVLYSIGPDGRDSGTLLAGGFVDSAPSENADNLYANRQ